MKDNYDFSEARRGPVLPPSPNKTRVTIRLDNDVIEWFRHAVEAAGGGNYQTLMNDALRRHMQQNGQPLEEMLRRVVRDELKRGGRGAGPRAAEG